MGARTFLSAPRSNRYFNAAEPSREDHVSFSWQYECVHVFLWALGYLPKLRRPARDRGRHE
jgi:hypothetical protein